MHANCELRPHRMLSLNWNTRLLYLSQYFIHVVMMYSCYKKSYYLMFVIMQYHHKYITVKSFIWSSERNFYQKPSRLIIFNWNVKGVGRQGFTHDCEIFPFISS